ncbi:MAG: FtsX-like permease family protein [Bifidobacteriaceae bacterium]|nr:FtsX-like permease family protein [Bifidobacteriaceae bacterium]
MLRVALKELTAQAGRYAMSLAAVVMGIAFLSGTMQLREGIAGAFQDLIEFQFDADVYVVPAEDGQAVLTQDWLGDAVEQTVALSLAERVEQVDGVDRVVPDIRGGAVLAGADGTAIAGVGAGAPGLGLSWGSYERGSAVRVAAGRGPAAVGEVAVMEDTARRGGLAVGDATTVFTGEAVLDVTVVGILESDAAGFLGASLTFFTADQALDLYAAGGGVARLAIYSEVDEAGTAAGGPAALADRVTAALAGASGSANGDGADGIGGFDSGGAQGQAGPFVVVTGDELREGYTADLRAAIGAIGAVLTVFAVVALFVAGFIIFNTFNITVRRQTARYALLRALGASGKQVFAVVAAQGAVIGAVGAALGILAGKGLATLAVRGISAVGLDLGDHAVTRWTDVALALVVGVAVTMAAAAVPARRAGRVAPVEALRQVEAEFGRLKRGRAWAGGIVLAMGVAATWAGAVVDAAPAALVGAGGVAIVVGAIVAGPLLASAGARAAGAVFGRVAPPIGRLAVRNLQRNPRRDAATASALMIGLALMSVSAVVANSMKASSATDLDRLVRSDLFVSTASTAGLLIPGAAVAAIEDVAGVERVDPVAAGAATVSGLPVYMGSVPGEAIGDTLDLDVDTGASGSPFEGGRVLAEEGAAKDFGWTVGSRLVLVGDAGQVEVEIGGLYGRGLGGEQLIVGPDVFGQVVGPLADWSFEALVRFGDGADATATRADVAAAAAPFMILTVQDRAELIAEANGMVELILAVIYGLLALSVVIAVMGIVNTLALSVIERQRELGLLRAIGLGRGLTAATVALESVLLALGGAVLGASIGLGVGAGLARALRDQGITELALPWADLGVMVLAGALAGVVAAIAPAIRAVRVPPLVALAR